MAHRNDHRSTICGIAAARMGGFQQFLQQYLLECLTIGYPDAPMEQEAITTALRICP